MTRGQGEGEKEIPTKKCILLVFEVLLTNHHLILKNLIIGVPDG